VTARTIAGWTALASGLLLVVAMAGSALVAGVTGNVNPTAFRWMTGTGMGPEMMRFGTGPGRMGPGMMGFGTSGPAATPIPGAAEVRVEAANFSFTPNEIRLPANADVNLTLVNPSETGTPHDLTVPTLGIHIVAGAGETKTVGVRGLAPGRYDAYCSVPGHADRGMRATVVVQ
jgi:plastocyanin